jgi:hypothetical protein
MQTRPRQPAKRSCNIRTCGANFRARQAARTGRLAPLDQQSESHHVAQSRGCASLVVAASFESNMFERQAAADARQALHFAAIPGPVPALPGWLERNDDVGRVAALSDQHREAVASAARRQSGMDCSCSPRLANYGLAPRELWAGQKRASLSRFPRRGSRASVPLHKHDIATRVTRAPR